MKYWLPDKTDESFKASYLKSSPESLTSLKSIIFFQIKLQVITAVTRVDSSPHIWLRQAHMCVQNVYENKSQANIYVNNLTKLS